LFSDKVKKINQNDWNQERILVITKSRIFNIHKAKVKRAIEIESLDGISKN